MKEKIIFILSLIFFTSFISAITVIEIKTLPSQDMYITPIDSGSSFSAIGQPKHYTSDAYGDLKIMFDLERYPFDLAIKIMQGEKTLLYEKVRGIFKDGEVRNITIAPEGIELLQTPIEEPEVVEENITEESKEIENITLEKETTNLTSKKNVLINGYVILNGTTSSKKIIYSGLTALLIAGTSLFVIKKRRAKKRKINQNTNDGKKPEIKKGEELIKAEKELKQAQRKINSLKNKEKIDEVKKKLINDEKELIKLRNGEEPETKK